MSNPLLDFSGQIPFDRITPADVAPAVDQLLAGADAALARVTATDFPAQWDAIARVLANEAPYHGESAGPYRNSPSRAASISFWAASGLPVASAATDARSSRAVVAGGVGATVNSLNAMSLTAIDPSLWTTTAETS